MQRWQKIYWHLNKAYVFESRFSWPIGQPKFVWHKLPMATNFICSDPLTASNFNASRAYAEAAVTCFSKPFLHLCNWTLHHETLFLCVSNSLLLSLQVPSTYHLQALMSEPRLQPESLPHIQGIFHFTPPFIMRSKEYLEWMAKFPDHVQHVMINEGATGYESVGKNQLQRNRAENLLLVIRSVAP